MHVHRRTIDSIIVTVWARCQFERHCTADPFKHNFTASRLFARTPLCARTTTSQVAGVVFAPALPHAHIKHTTLMIMALPVHCALSLRPCRVCMPGWRPGRGTNGSSPRRRNSPRRAAPRASTTQTCAPVSRRRRLGGHALMLSIVRRSHGCMQPPCCTHALARVPTGGSIRWIMHAHGNDVTIRTC